MALVVKNLAQPLRVLADIRATLLVSDGIQTLARIPIAGDGRLCSIRMDAVADSGHTFQQTLSRWNVVAGNPVQVGTDDNIGTQQSGLAMSGYAGVFSLVPSADSSGDVLLKFEPNPDDSGTKFCSVSISTLQA